MGVALVRQIHDAFVEPGRGVIWKMDEDLSSPYPGYGFGALDAFDLGMMLWMAQFFPDEGWARTQKTISFDVLADRNEGIIGLRGQGIERIINASEWR